MDFKTGGMLAFSPGWILAIMTCESLFVILGRFADPIVIVDVISLQRDVLTGGEVNLGRATQKCGKSLAGSALK